MRYALKRRPSDEDEQQLKTAELIDLLLYVSLSMCPITTVRDHFPHRYDRRRHQLKGSYLRQITDCQALVLYL
jgi:hypothetical protein